MPHRENIMIVRSLVTLALATAIFGYAGISQGCPLPPPGDQAANVIVYRPALDFQKYVAVPISIDNCAVGELENERYIRYKLAAGKHKVRAEIPALASGQDSEVVQEFAAGTMTYLRFAMRKGEPKFDFWAPFGGALSSSGTFLELVSRETALRELPRITKPQNVEGTATKGVPRESNEPAGEEQNRPDLGQKTTTSDNPFPQ